MAKKLFTALSIIGILLLALSCESNDNTGPKPKEDYVLTKSGGIISPGETSNKTTLTLSNITGEGFQGAGEYLSLLLVNAADEVTEPYYIPDGEYNFSESDGSDKSILKSTSSFFVTDGKNNNKDARRITGGQITISRNNAAYTITGELTGGEGKVFKFKYEGEIKVFILQIPIPETNEVVLNEAKVIYDNKFTASNNMFTHIITLLNAEGEKLNLEVFSNANTSYDNIVTGDYSLASIVDSPKSFDINPSANSFYIDPSGEKLMFASISLNLVKDIDSYVITGDFMLEDNSEKTFTFEGALKVSEANLVFPESSMEMYIQGQYWTFTAFEYYMGFETTERGNVGELLKLYLTNPINRYYNYLPLKNGTYTVTDESGIGEPLNIINDQYISDAAVCFRNAQGELQNMLLESGTMDLTCEEVSNGYALTLKGTVLTEEEVTGGGVPKTLTVNFTFKDVIPKSGYYATPAGWHPYSTAKGSKNFDQYHFEEGVFYRENNGYWNGEGGSEDTGWIWITIGTWGAEFQYVYYNQDGADPFDEFLNIGLHIDPTIPEFVIPTGKFTLDHDWEFKAGTFMPGMKYGHTNNYCASTMIFNADLSMDIPIGYGAGGSYITITKDEIDDDEDNWYTVKFLLYDDKGIKANKFTGEFSLPLMYFDDWEEEFYAAPPMSRIKPYNKGSYKYRATGDYLNPKRVDARK